jgi:protein-tyrosine phosphatase
MKMISVPETKFSQAYPRLDLFYVLPNLLVGSYPLNWKSFFSGKTSLDLIVEILTKNFDKALIINLATERPLYSVKNHKIQYQLIDWVDYHAFPIFNFINLVHSIINYLHHKKRAVFIHCKHGKGRTGTLICGILILLFNLTPNEAYNVFMNRRKLFDTNIYIKSQNLMLDSFTLLFHRNIKTYINIRDSTKTWIITDLFISASNSNKQRKLGVSIGNLNNLTKNKKNIKFDLKFNIITNQSMVISHNVNEDVCFEFECFSGIKKLFATYTFNCVVEYLIKVAWNKDINKSKEQTHNREKIVKSKDTVEMNITVPFEKMDGIKGTSFKGTKYFESVNITLVRISN